MLRHFYKKSLLLLCLLGSMALTGCGFSDMLQTADTGSVSAVPAAVQHDYQLAISRMEAGDTAEAEQLLQKFVADYPEYANAYVNLAIILDERGDSTAAVRLLEHAAELDGNNVAALNRLGLIKRQLGDFSAAEQAWLKATRVDPEYANAWYNLGVLYDLYLQDLPAALGYYRRYQTLVAEESPDATVQRWIVDLQRRIDRSFETANAMEAM